MKGTARCFKVMVIRSIEEAKVILWHTKGFQNSFLSIYTVKGGKRPCLT
jgi:hypothetical protein